eukprot:TCONS_00052845-protein
MILENIGYILFWCYGLLYCMEIYQKHITFSSICISYAVGASCILMIATTFLYPTKEVLQAFIDVETVNNIRPQLSDDEDTDDENLVDTASSHVMRSQDFASNSIMSSYQMYHEAIHKSLEQIKEAERRETLLASLSENLAIQFSNRSYDANDHKIQYLPSRPYGTIMEGSVGYQQDSYSASSHLVFNIKNNKEDEKTLLLPIQPTREEHLTPYSGHKLRQYIFSKLMIFGTYTASVMMFKIVYFIGNLDKYLNKLTDTETATLYIKYFGYVQFGGIIAAPICSMLFRENVGTERLSAHQDFVKKVKILILPGFLLILFIVLIDVLQLVQNIYLSVPIFILFLFGNSLVWCFTSLYFAYLFPAKYYCTLYGIATGVSGAVSFLQYPLLSLENSLFHGEQFYTNLLMLGLLISTLVLPFYLVYFYKKLKMAEIETQEKP